MKSKSNDSIDDAGHASFFVGVVGDAIIEDEREIEAFEERIRRLFCFLRHGGKYRQSAQSRPIIEEILDDLVPDDSEEDLRRSYRVALKEWRGLSRETPIAVLTNLAPGVETIVANLVQKDFAQDKFRLQIVLPLPPHLYLGSSPFEVPGDREATKQRRTQFLDILTSILERSSTVTSLSDALNADGSLSIELTKQLENLDLSPSDLFTTALDDDAGVSFDELKDRWAKDRWAKDHSSHRAKLHQRCDRRFEAASEYLAIAPHLMVAIWNGRRDESRVSQAAEARLRGPKPDILPTSTYLQMPHGGPLWHLTLDQNAGCDPCHFVTNGNCASLRRTSIEDAGGLPNTRILHPYASSGECRQSEIVAAEQPTDIPLQSDRFLMFARMAENLSNFNQEYPRYRASEQAEMSAVFPRSGRSYLDDLSIRQPHSADRLRSVLCTKMGAAGLGNHLQKRNDRSVTILFLLTLLGVSLLHASDAPWNLTAVETPATSQLLTYPQYMLGGAALVVFLIAVLYFAIQRSLRIEQRTHDSRAIAEGLRVQFFWNLVGVGRSVSANYMTRHRSELDWVAAVIRSTTIPYVQWRHDFERLDRQMQIRAIKVVRDGWIRHQLNYFTAACTKKHHVMCVWHEFGGVTGLAGVLTFLHTFLWSAGYVSWASGWWLYGSLLLVVIAGATSFAFAIARVRNRRRSPTPTIDVHTDLWDGIIHSLIEFTSQPRNFIASVASNEKKRLDKVLKIDRPSQWSEIRALQSIGHIFLYAFDWLKRLLWLPLQIIDALVPSLRTPPAQRTSWWPRFWRGTMSFALYIPLAIVLTMMVHWLSESISQSYTAVPRVRDLCFVFAGILLLAGGTSIAWAEKNFFSELSYQYNTMATLFHTADMRLDESLRKLASHGENDKDYSEDLTRIQQLLYRLGQEALAENAEWLLLHRARPLEPLMPG